VNSLPKTVTRQRCGCDLKPGPSAPESSVRTTSPSESGTVKTRSFESGVGYASRRRGECRGGWGRGNVGHSGGRSARGVDGQFAGFKRRQRRRRRSLQRRPSEYEHHSTTTTTTTTFLEHQLCPYPRARAPLSPPAPVPAFARPSPACPAAVPRWGGPPVPCS